MGKDKKASRVVANFKQNGSRHFFEAFVEALSASRGQLWDPEGIHLVLCPPFPYLSLLADLKGIMFEVGAQDCGLHSSGSFTGEVSAAMLRDVGCQWVILGHNERRLWASDTQESIGQKIKLAFEAGLSPLVCVGESLEMRQAGRAAECVTEEVSLFLKDCPLQMAFSVAYEPLWAIGTGMTPSLEEIEEIHGALEILLQSRGVTDPLLLYGGSVTPENATQILRCQSVGGGLVGRPCLDPKVFISLLGRLSPVGT